MADINLYEAQQGRLERANKKSLGLLVFSVTCVVLALGGYGGLWFWVGMKDAKIADLKAQAEKAKEGLVATNEETDQVHDVFLRLGELKKANSYLVSEKFLEEIQKNIVNGAVLSDFSYDRAGNTVTVAGDAVDFNTLLQQMRRFQGDPAFSSVKLASAGISSEKSGFILFSIDFQVPSKQ